MSGREAKVDACQVGAAARARERYALLLLVSLLFALQCSRALRVREREHCALQHAGLGMGAWWAALFLGFAMSRYRAGLLAMGLDPDTGEVIKEQRDQVLEKEFVEKYPNGIANHFAMRIQAWFRGHQVARPPRLFAHRCRRREKLRGLE